MNTDVTSHPFAPSFRKLLLQASKKVEKLVCWLVGWFFGLVGWVFVCCLEASKSSSSSFPFLPERRLTSAACCDRSLPKRAAVENAFPYYKLVKVLVKACKSQLKHLFENKLKLRKSGDFLKDFFHSVNCHPSFSHALTALAWPFSFWLRGSRNDKNHLVAREAPIGISKYLDSSFLSLVPHSTHKKRSTILYPITLHYAVLKPMSYSHK